VDTLWFVKSRRAQTVSDVETWIEGGVTPTLNAFDTGDTRATVLIIDGTRVGDVRIYEDEISQTVISRWGTGGGNVPYVFPIQDGRKMEKNQNGLGIGDDTDPSYTLDQTGAQSVAYAVDSNENGWVDKMGSLTAGQNSGGTQQAVAYDEYNDSIAETHHTLRAGTQQSTSAIQNAVVRRLTPTECERLQGFPDGWTDGQADSHRYKQMGNAVTVNVIRWIGARL